jgi:hypothetical protein
MWFSAMFGAASVFILLALWLTAWFGGKYAVIMTINDYGEAVPELIMYCIVIPVFVVGLWHTLKLIKTVE